MQRTKLAIAVSCLALGLTPPAFAGNVTVGSGATLDLGTGSLALGCADLDVLGTLSAGGVGFAGGRDVTVTPSGVLNGNSATLELSGDWDNSGTFDAGTGSVRLVDGCGLLGAVVVGNTSFNNLAMSTTSAKQVSFTAGSTQTISGLFSALGSIGNLLVIRSTVNGIAAFLYVLGASSADFVDVRDNDARPGNDIALGSNSVKGSYTPGWQLSPPVPLIPPLAFGMLLLMLLAIARRGLPSWRQKALTS